MKPAQPFLSDEELLKAHSTIPSKPKRLLVSHSMYRAPEPDYTSLSNINNPPCYNVMPKITDIPTPSSKKCDRCYKVSFPSKTFCKFCQAELRAELMLFVTIQDESIPKAILQDPIGSARVLLGAFEGYSLEADLVCRQYRAYKEIHEQMQVLHAQLNRWEEHIKVKFDIELARYRRKFVASQRDLRFAAGITTELKNEQRKTLAVSVMVAKMFADMKPPTFFVPQQDEKLVAFPDFMFSGAWDEQFTHEFYTLIRKQFSENK